MDLKIKARNAVIRYLALKGYDVLDEEFDGFVIAADTDNSIHIIDVSVVDKCKPKPQVNKSREEYEHVMCKWIASHLSQDDYLDVEIYPDICNLVVFNESRALIKHYINVQELM